MKPEDPLIIFLNWSHIQTVKIAPFVGLVTKGKVESAMREASTIYADIVFCQIKDWRIMLTQPSGCALRVLRGLANEQ